MAAVKLLLQDISTGSYVHLVVLACEVITVMDEELPPIYADGHASTEVLRSEAHTLGEAAGQRGTPGLLLGQWPPLEEHWEGVAPTVALIALCERWQAITQQADSERRELQARAPERQLDLKSASNNSEQRRIHLTRAAF